MEINDFSVIYDDYELVEILPLMQRLTEKYTSKDSTSVTYETANMLMTAVLYSLRAAYQGNGQLKAQIRPSAKLLYEKGSTIIFGKALAAKSVYEELIRDFEDYGVQNYRDTILQEIPKFFYNYDPVYCPQEHGVDLDYPLAEGYPMGSGVEFLYAYLEGIRQEAQALESLGKWRVIERLEQEMAHYGRNFLGNIYALVFDGKLSKS
ncbi:hypothetical protein FACS1894111_08450 [Clostridia bacterium]|nr:hypothetical protein FACS1894111_08450 [Clostridia bacterium]